jgi:DNA-directed RNA polymerase beta' subunit
MKIIFLTLCSFFIYNYSFSQINKSELVITEKGINLEDAKKNALSKAISQIYGVYVSSDINIQNEKILKDEIIMSSFGNIDKSEILAKYLDTIKNEYFVTIKFSFSIDNFLEISKSKGIKLLIDGNELANQYIIDKVNDIAITQSYNITTSILPQLNEPIGFVI